MSETDSNRKSSQCSSNGGDLEGHEDLETYTVKDGDSLNKIAAFHDTTPTKLAQINKLSSSRAYVFQGQILKLPPPEPPKPPTPEPQIDKDVIDLKNKFIRINVKHMTMDRGIVDGTILLTAKLAMFDPYTHHPLVKESGPEKYQLILPMQYIVNAVILSEFNRNSDVETDMIFHPDETVDIDDVIETGVIKDAKNKDDKEDQSEIEQNSSKGEKMMYLRIRMGQPIGSKIKRDEMISTYGEATVLPDYWIILTEERAIYTYIFFKIIRDDFQVYGVPDVMAIERCGYDLVREGCNPVEPEAGRSANRASVSKMQGNQHLSFTSVDFSAIAPMQGTSELMEKEDRIYLTSNMPQKLEGQTWILTFSTSANGFSLQNMMRKLSTCNGPMLLVLSDLRNNIFGAFFSSVPITSEHFEGTGETFLFSLKPKEKAYKWTGENNFFFRVDTQCLIVGSSKGKFGLWIDRDIDKGRSQPCETFDNPPLAGDEDFTVKTLECWLFDMLY